MSRKHFEALAAMMRRHYVAMSFDGVSAETVKRLANDMADFCYTNAKQPISFDRLKFLKACGV